MTIFFKKTLKITIISTILLSLNACVENIRPVGHAIKKEDIAKIKPNSTRKFSVTKILGSPSAKSTYGKEVWYYISTVYSQKAFFDPEIKEQTVVAIKFDGEVVDSISKFNKDDMQNIELSKDITPTEGHDESVIGQLLGNVGRFNSSPSDVTKPR